MTRRPRRSSWKRDGNRLLCCVDVSVTWLELAQQYATHRLRKLRGKPLGFHHPTEVDLASDLLTLSFPPGALDGRDLSPISLPRWRDQYLLPLLDTLVLCYEHGIAGLGSAGIIGGRWVPPVEWFLPVVTGEQPFVDIEAFQAAAAWVDAEGRHNSEVGTFVRALKSQDPKRLRCLVTDSRQQVERGEAGRLTPPSFLTLLTEAELLERVSTTYRYRLMRSRDIRRLGLNPKTQLVLQVDRRWADPHFPSLARRSVQEVWESLVDESRVTPLLAVSEHLPNALEARVDRGTDVIARWVGVHEDQSLIYLDFGDTVPREGFVRLHLAGDDAVMSRKRKFTEFSGEHPTLESWRETPPAKRPFVENPQTRDVLEDTILATRGVFAVQGPPGTGKTHLATEVVRRFLREAPTGRVLICAKEHFALDHILRRITAALTEDGCRFRAWRSVPLARRRRGQGIDRTWIAPAVTQELGARGWTESAKSWSQWQAATVEHHDQRLATLGQQSANLFFATTMDSAMVDFVGTESFDLVIVEEAGKCYPSELLHALCLGRTTLMIGDQRQLPPFQERQTREAIDAWSKAIGRARVDGEFRAAMEKRFGLRFCSLLALARDRGPLNDVEHAWLRPFEFLFDRLSTRHRLEEQFRMEAPLSRAVGEVFYDRAFVHRKQELVAAGKLLVRPLADVVPPTLDVPMLWLDTPHMKDVAEATEDFAKRGVRDNKREATVILNYLRALRPGQPVDLVILTPYNAQKRLLLADREIRAVCELLTSRPLEEVVRTTDEYQGREAELTILSLVRNNSQGANAWGFMTEPERLNVMFSRTRYRQVVVGCSAHIERHKQECPYLYRFWLAYTKEAKSRGCARILPTRKWEIACG